jgi:hypothetical protein
MTPTEFSDKYLPFANQLAANLGFNSPDVFLSQWALETDWGNSELAVRYNNLAGINYNGVACYRAVGGFAGYTSLDQFVLGATYTFKINDYGYPAFLATKDGTFSEQADALGQTDWAASHYRATDSTVDGSALQAFYDELPKLNTTTTDPTPTSTPTATVTNHGTLHYTMFSSDTSGVAGVEAISKEAWGTVNVSEVLRYAPQLNGDAANYLANEIIFIPNTASAPAL